MGRKKAATACLFKPLSSIIYVSEREISEIGPEDVTVEQVGKKAFGLSCLPKHWTLSFFVVSSELLSLHKNCLPEDREELIRRWNITIVEAAHALGIQDQEDIIVRSSGCAEGIEERGNLCSVKGTLINMKLPLSECLNELSNDKEIKNQPIPLIVQRYVVPISARGHLSNERRCYEEFRDWLGDYEDEKNPVGEHFAITLRNWRKKHAFDEYLKRFLDCNLSAHVSEVLKIPAAWAYERKVRVHFEWVWDGKAIFLVQADQEQQSQGINPTIVFKYKPQLPASFVPKCLKVINKEHALRYNKIRNVFTYMELELPTTTLYVLDDQDVIKALASGDVSPDLENDINELVKDALVIRTDIATEDLNLRQLLPRVEVREKDGALNWLKERSAHFKHNGVREDLAFIFHNFVPAVSSAFAYAVPGHRKVQIEALWGLPEGLYFNAHDKYIVDTQTPRVENLIMDRFTYHEKRNFKKFFVSPENDGRWTSKILKAPYDWYGSIQKEEWIKEIAYQSRRIVEATGKPLTIMWFVGVSSDICSRNVFPWYHEEYDQISKNRTPTHRTKTPFDKSLTIQTQADVELLRQETLKSKSNVRRIRIQPCEEQLLRDKDILHDIGNLAQKIDAIILLEGGILSHQYYQLMQTNAIVEVLNPFSVSEDKREFDKLVRDKVPYNIEQGGELVDIGRISGEFLLRALREKLVEESFEVLDAVDQESIIGELADVNEVIEGILTHIGVNRSEVDQRKKEKYEKAGGFKEGIVLLETRNPLSAKKDLDKTSLFDESDYTGEGDSKYDARRLTELNHKIDRWSDRREHKAASETIMTFKIPMVRDKWNASTVEKSTDSDKESGVRIQLDGTRLGSKYQIEVSIFSQHKKHEQLFLFDSEEPEED